MESNEPVPSKPVHLSRRKAASWFIASALIAFVFICCIIGCAVRKRNQT